MKIIVGVLCFLGVFFSGCTKATVGCIVETTIVDAATPAIVKALQCSNTAQIQTDLEALIGKLGFCTQTTSGNAVAKPKLSAPVCDVFSRVVIGAMTGGIPTSWGCTAANAQTLLTGALSTACQNL
jgi:hypothetical protein